MYPWLLILGFPELPAASYAPPGTSSTDSARAIVVHVKCPRRRNNEGLRFLFILFASLFAVGGARGSRALRTILFVCTFSAPALLMMQTLVVVLLLTHQAPASQ
jgi:hypothetical protein